MPFIGINIHFIIARKLCKSLFNNEIIETCQQNGKNFHNNMKKNSQKNEIRSKT